MKVSWTGVQDVANNRTNISFTVQPFGGSDDWYTTGPIYINMNGKRVYTFSDRVDMRLSWSDSGTTVIDHNEDGTKSFGIYIEAAIETYAINCSGSGTFTLDPIARNPDAPTALSASAGHGSMVGFGQTVNLSWSGAGGTISGYEIQVKRGSADWAALATISTTGTGGSYADTITDTTIAKTGAGKSLQYRVRAMNGALPSAWKNSAVLTMGGGMDFKVSGTWKKATVWRKVSGSWTRIAIVWRNVGGTWHEGT